MLKMITYFHECLYYVIFKYGDIFFYFTNTGVVKSTSTKQKLNILIIWTYFMYILAFMKRSFKFCLNDTRLFFSPFSTYWKWRKSEFWIFFQVLKTKSFWCLKFFKTILIITARFFYKNLFAYIFRILCIRPIYFPFSYYFFLTLSHSRNVHIW